MGVLAIQGGFEVHCHALPADGVEAVEVRTAQQLDDLDGIVIPGGESTTIGMGLVESELERPLREFVASGKPTFGTCAGLILLDEQHLGLLDVRTTRNAYGRQIRSFEAPVKVAGLGKRPFVAVFIRAPRVEAIGPGVEILAELEGDPVVVREGNILAVAFHPELTEDRRLHEMFGEMVAEHASQSRQVEALQ